MESDGPIDSKILKFISGDLSEAATLKSWTPGARDIYGNIFLSIF